MPTSIAFFGTPEFAVPILDSLSQQFAVKAVITQPDRPAGKGLVTFQSPVAKLADQLDLPIFKPDRLKDEPFRSQISAIPVDIAVVAAYGKIIPQWLLDWPAQGMINVHGSLLPKYRGASPINSAILAGETVTGITFMKMSAGLDEGDTLQTFEQPILATDTAASLSINLSQLAAEHIIDVVKNYLNGLIIPVPQDSASATYTTSLDSSQGKVDFISLPHHLERMIRAYYPWPGVWGEFRGKRVKLLPNARVQMEGKKPAPLADFLHGYPDFPIKSLD